eukprot:6731730-Alexandrium_andersonii.AAC.1
MSASLVGSEMCIRDSNCIVLVLSVRLARHASRKRAVLVLGVQSAWHVSVSYTHLTLPTICSV